MSWWSTYLEPPPTMSGSSREVLHYETVWVMCNFCTYYYVITKRR